MIENKNNIDDKERSKMFHSSGYADVASGNIIGSVDNTSFLDRQKLEFNRKIIAGYNRSNLGMSYGALRAKQVSGEDRITRPVDPPLRRFNGVNSMPLSTRKYNPFA